jgi:hypothetical protein
MWTHTTSEKYHYSIKVGLNDIKYVTVRYLNIVTICHRYLYDYEVLKITVFHYSLSSNVGIGTSTCGNYHYQEMVRFTPAVAQCIDNRYPCFTATSHEIGRCKVKTVLRASGTSTSTMSSRLAARGLLVLPVVP